MKKISICLLFILTTIKISQAQSLSKFLGDTYFNHLAYAKALKYYERALKKDSSNLYILRHLAQSYKNSGDFSKAEELYGLLHTKKDTASMEEYAHLLIYNNKYHYADSLIAQFNLTLPAYNKQLIDSLMNAKPKYDVTLAGINTKYSDFLPCISKDNLIFTSARDTSRKEYEWNGQPYLSLFIADMYENGNLGQVRPFTEIDSRYHISSFQYVKSAGRAYFTMNNANAFSTIKDANNEVNLGIYVSKLKKGHWQKPVPLEKVTSKDYSSAHPFFSPSDDRLYFSSNRPGGYGGSDIYYVDVYPRGTSDPVNCGETINTPADEVYPFVLSDGMLYFSSDGHPGLGGLDVFCAKIDDDLFSDVTNLAPPINSSRDDFSLVFNEDQSVGYLASNRSGGVGDDDIYLVKKIKPTKKIKKKTVKEDNQAKEEVASKEHFFQGEGIPDKQAETPLLATNTSINTIPGQMIIGTPPPVEISQPVKTVESGLTPKQELTIETVSEILDKAQPKAVASNKNQLNNLKFRLNNLNFDFNSWDINAEAARELDKLVDLMKKYNSMTIELSSHTDCRGNNAYNKVLSQARADAALKYILKKGINISRITAIGYGEQKPLNHCIDGVDCSEELHQENRRVEVLIKGFE